MSDNVERLFSAIKRQDLDQVNEVLNTISQPGQLQQAKKINLGVNGNSLYCAILSNDTPGIALAILTKAQALNCSGSLMKSKLPRKNTTIMHELAKKARFAPVIESFVSKDDANREGIENVTPLQMACSKNTDPEVARAFLVRGANVDAEDEEGNTAMHQVAMKADYKLAVEMAKILVEYRADLEKENSSGNTAVQEAEKAGNSELVAYLMEVIEERKGMSNGADTNEEQAVAAVNIPAQQASPEPQPPCSSAKSYPGTPKLSTKAPDASSPVTSTPVAPKPSSTHASPIVASPLKSAPLAASSTPNVVPMMGGNFSPQGGTNLTLVGGLVNTSGAGSEPTLTGGLINISQPADQASPPVVTTQVVPSLPISSLVPGTMISNRVTELPSQPALEHPLERNKESFPEEEKDPEAGVNESQLPLIENGEKTTAAGAEDEDNQSTNEKGQKQQKDNKMLHTLKRIWSTPYLCIILVLAVLLTAAITIPVAGVIVASILGDSNLPAASEGPSPLGEVLWKVQTDSVPEYIASIQVPESKNTTYNASDLIEADEICGSVGMNRTWRVSTKDSVRRFRSFFPLEFFKQPKERHLVVRNETVMTYLHYDIRWVRYENVSLVYFNNFSDFDDLQIEAKRKAAIAKNPRFTQPTKDDLIENLLCEK